jgi:hypothetical protein
VTKIRLPARDQRIIKNFRTDMMHLNDFGIEVPELGEDRQPPCGLWQFGRSIS